MSFSEDPTQGRERGATPGEDPMGPGVADTTADPTRGADVGGPSSEDPTQGVERGETADEDPTQGGERGSLPGEDPTAPAP